MPVLIYTTQGAQRLSVLWRENKRVLKTQICVTHPQCINNHVQNPNRNSSQRNFHTFGRAELTASRAKRLQGSMNDIKSNT